ncbi:hypothetical protein IJE86_08125 [bacterium]|nr:hypothetical protein [bacterium]
MADVKLRMELNPNASEETLGNITNYGESGATNSNLANTSIKAQESGLFIDANAMSGEGSNGFTWGEDDYLVFNEYDYLDNFENSNAYLESETNPSAMIWGVVPENGEYYVKLTFTNATNLKDVQFYGDAISGQFPTRAIIDGTKELFSDDPEWSVNFETESDTHTIEFTDWNRGNYNATLTKISVVPQYIEFDKLSMKNIESLSQTTASPNDIFYGVIANSGSASIVDVKGEVRDYIKDNGSFNSNTPCEIIANGNVVQHHIANDSDYDTQSKTFSVDLTNLLQSWDGIKYSGFPLEIEGGNSSKTAYQILWDIFKSSLDGFTEQKQFDKLLDTKIVFGNDNVEGTVSDYLKNITIPYGYMEAGTLKDSVEKICRLAQLQVYINENNEIKFVSARPVMTSEENKNIIVVPSNRQSSQLSETIILKNKFDAVEIEETKITDEVLFNEALHTYTTTTNPLLYNVGWDVKDDNNIVVDYGENVVRVESYYVTGSFTFPKKENLNLSSVVLVYEGKDANEETYTKHSDNCIVYSLNIDEKSLGGLGGSHSKAYQRATSGEYTSFDVGLFGETPEIYYEEITLKDLSLSLNNASVSLKDTSYFNIFDDGEEYRCDYKVLTGVLKLSFQERIVPDSASTVVWHNVSLKKYTAQSTSIAVYGDKRKISSVNISASDSNIATAKSIAQVGSSELLQTGTKYKGTKMSTIIKNNIKQDYSTGISNGSINIICDTYYDEDGNLVKNWGVGEVIKPYEIVRIDKNNNGDSQSEYKDGSPRYWRVTGRNFLKTGVPLINLELQEVKLK